TGLGEPHCRPGCRGARRRSLGVRGTSRRQHRPPVLALSRDLSAESRLSPRAQRGIWSNSEELTCRTREIVSSHFIETHVGDIISTSRSIGRRDTHTLRGAIL